VSGDDSRTPIDRIDAILVITMLAFAGTSLLFDRCAALDIIAADSADPFARAIHWYGQRYDPLVVANPLWLRIMSALSAFVYGPLYLWLAYARLRHGRWPRLAATAWAWTLLYSMVVHLAVELLGDLNPPDLVVFAGVYAPYVIAPALLLRRLGR
jgi:hypothetical protein